MLSFTGSYLLYLSAAGDFNESTDGVEGARPTGIDMCSIVVVEDSDKVSTLQLETEKGQEKKYGWLNMYNVYNHT